MAKAPWFKTYAQDLLLDSKLRKLPLAAQGLVYRMWCVIWLEGCISSDPKEIAQVCLVDISDVQMYLQMCLQMFHKDVDGTLYSPRMDREREHSEKVSFVRAAAVAKRHDRQNKGLSTNDVTKPIKDVDTKDLLSESESDTTTPLPPKRGKRRSRTELVSGFSEPTREVVNTVLKEWPKERPGNHSTIRPDTALLASRVDEIFVKHPKVTTDILLEAAHIYLAEKKPFLHAPEFFYGPGKNGDGPPWYHYAKMAFHKKQQAVTQ